jgi:methyl coenzyme M reductase subunit C-like uncharacterized protein (methanogenesis marker protein 7)
MKGRGVHEKVKTLIPTFSRHHLPHRQATLIINIAEIPENYGVVVAGLARSYYDDATD